MPSEYRCPDHRLIMILPESASAIEGAGRALFEIVARQMFVGIDLGSGRDETAVTEMTFSNATYAMPRSNPEGEPELTIIETIRRIKRYYSQSFPLRSPGVRPLGVKDDSDDRMMTISGMKPCHGLDLIKEADAVLADKLLMRRRSIVSVA